MKIEIEISDFYLEENEGEFQEQLKEYILRECIQKVRTANHKLINDVIQSEVQKMVVASLTETVQKDVKEIIETGRINDKTVKEILLTEFSRGHGWSSPTEQMRELGKKLGEELKKRYDLAFAQQIITKMKELDFLKDDVVQKLLPESN